MSRYAEGTTVSEESSKAELETVLVRYGATGYGYLWDNDRQSVSVAFKVKSRGYRLEVPMPRPNDKAIIHDRYGHPRTTRQAENAYFNERRRRWRVVVLALKSKLELAALNEGDFTFEREFMAWAVLSDGRTVAQVLEEEGGLTLPGMPALMLPEASKK